MDKFSEFAGEQFGVNLVRSEADRIFRSRFCRHSKPPQHSLPYAASKVSTNESFLRA